MDRHLGDGWEDEPVDLDVLPWKPARYLEEREPRRLVSY